MISETKHTEVIVFDNDMDKFRSSLDQWFDSIMGITCLSEDILHFESYHPLLKARLESAFFAGAKAQLAMQDNNNEH